MAILNNPNYTDSSRNPYATFSSCMPDCTCYAFGRALDMGLPKPFNGGPGASNWGYVTLINGWTRKRWSEWSTKLKKGDIIVYSHTHVAICESPTNVSGSYYTGYRGYAIAPNETDFDPRPTNTLWASAPKGGERTVTAPTTVAGVMQWGVTYMGYRWWHDNNKPINDGSGDAQWVLVAPTAGGGGSEDGDGGGGGSGEGDGGDPGWESVYGDISETECGKAPSTITGETYDSGSQDNPKIPAVYSGNGKEDGWWRPLTTHTYERIYLFDKDGSGNGHWGDWVETKSYSRYYGEQDTPEKPMPDWVGTKNEGWVMDWD